MQILINKGGVLSEALCAQLKDYGLSISPNTSIFRNFAYNGRVYLDHQVYLTCCKVDAYSSIHTDTQMSRCQVGRYTTIATGCDIGLAGHGLSCFTTSTSLNQDGIFEFITPNIKRPGVLTMQYDGEFLPLITIGHDVTLEPLVLFPKAVTVGNGAIVRAGTVVTKDVPPYAIVANGSRGSQVVGSRFSDEIIADLLELKWWEYDIPLMLDHGREVPLHDIASFIEFMRFAAAENFPRIPEHWLYLRRDSEDKVVLFEVTADCKIMHLYPRLIDDEHLARARQELGKQKLYQEVRKRLHLTPASTGTQGITLSSTKANTKDSTEASTENTADASAQASIADSAEASIAESARASS